MLCNPTYYRNTNTNCAKRSLLSKLIACIYSRLYDINNILLFKYMDT